MAVAWTAVMAGPRRSARDGPYGMSSSGARPSKARPPLAIRILGRPPPLDREQGDQRRDTERRVQDDDADEGDPDPRRVRYRVGGPQVAVDDPRLAPDLRDDPAGLEGEDRARTPTAPTHAGTSEPSRSRVVEVE